MAGEPIEGTVLLLAGATASVPPRRLPDLVEMVQKELVDRQAEYDRSYELAAETDEFRAYFVEEGHWEVLGERCGLERRKWEAVQRAHREQLLHTGREQDRERAVESALEIREPVVIGRSARRNPL